MLQREQSVEDRGLEQSTHLLLKIVLLLKADDMAQPFLF
jgi:hypothetical protein